MSMGTDEERRSAGELLRRTAAIALDNPKPTLLSLALFTLTGLGADLADEATSLFFIMAYGILSIVLQYGLSVASLKRLGLLPGGQPQRGIWAMITVSVLTGTGILLGFVLVVPGIILAARWWASVPIVISEEVGIFEAIGRSWHETEGDFWPILGALVVVTIPWAGINAVYVMTDTSSLGPAILLALNLFASACAIAGWYIAVAIYAQIRTAPRLVEVFA